MLALLQLQLACTREMYIFWHAVAECARFGCTSAPARTNQIVMLGDHLTHATWERTALCAATLGTHASSQKVYSIDLTCIAQTLGAYNVSIILRLQQHLGRQT